jgi:hypothetical protein
MITYREDLRNPTPEDPQGLCLDRAYENADVRDLVGEYELTPHIRARGEEIADKVRTPAGVPDAGRRGQPQVVLLEIRLAFRRLAWLRTTLAATAVRSSAL